MDFGHATVTSPAPVRSAARLASPAAPALPSDPATTNTWPNVPLLAARGRGGNAMPTSCPVITCIPVEFVTATGGTPISLTATGPVAVSEIGVPPVAVTNSTGIQVITGQEVGIAFPPRPRDRRHA